MTTSSLSRSNSSYTSSSNRKNPLVCIWIVAMSLFLSVSFILTPPDDSDGSGLDNLLSYSQQQQQRGRDDTGYNKVNNVNDTSNSVNNDHDKPMSTLKKKSKPSSTSTSSRTTTFVECSIITPYSTLPKDETAKGKITIAVYHYNNDIPDNNHNNDDAEYFLQLVRLGYYDGLYFLRVVKNFVAQFGYDHLHTIQDKDKPKRIKKKTKENDKNGQHSSSSTTKNQQQLLLSNVRGTITLVGGNTGQVFINTGNNSRLDKEGSLPFGEIISKDGEGQSQNQQIMMTQVIDKIYTGYKPGSGQIKVLKDSKNVEIEIQNQFPNMSKIEYCRIITVT